MGEHKRANKLETKLRASNAITAAILEQVGIVKVARERLNEIVNSNMEAVVDYNAETDEYTFAPAATG